MHCNQISQIWVSVARKWVGCAIEGEEEIRTLPFPCTFQQVPNYNQMSLS